MSALTNNERDGLNEVFLSIHTDTNKYQKIKELSSLIMTHHTTAEFINLLKQAKYGMKGTKLSHFILNFTKKKK